ncbi:hypothetical protein LTS18_014417, partial [Coniosporium uncinatum]
TLVSADTEGRVLMWDLNRREFVREIEHADKRGRKRRGVRVQCAKISGVTGHLALARGRMLALYTVNGSLLLERDVCGGEEEEEEDDEVASLAFYEGVGNEWVERELVFTGHRRGVVNCWNLTTDRAGAWTLELVKRLNHVDLRREGANYAAAVSCILPMAQVVYTGDEEGRV